MAASKENRHRMRPFRFLAPKPTISDQEVTSGLRWLTWEGTVSLGFTSITTSGFLVAFALALGANNHQIGILVAIPFLAQIVQIPAIGLVERIRRRKQIVVLSWFPAQLLWFPIALIPLFIEVPGATAISVLLWLMAVRGLLSAVTNSAWNGWIRELVPKTILGRFFSRRLLFATVTAVVFTLGAAFFVDYWRGHVPEERAIFGYTYVLLFGALFLGLASPIFMSLMPEPLMQPLIGAQPPLWQRLAAPIKDANFRRLLQFLLFWGFASNLAIPFFAVYMLVRLELPLSLVLGLGVLSQLFNILFLRVWGAFADRFGNKAVLSLSISLLLLVILGWIFTTMPERHFLTMPLIVLLHVFAGIANAGATLTVGTIGLKLAPRGEATSYLASASLATNLGAGVGPLCGGLLADFFRQRQLEMTFSWTDAATTVQLTPLAIIGHDFLFAIAFIVGMLSLGSLARIREKGEVGREVLLESLFSPAREWFRPMSTILGGYNLLADFPLGFVKRVPIPGLDVAFGVTAFQIAEIARAATLTAVHGRRLTRKLVNRLESGLSRIWKATEEVKEHGIEITREAARGAMHVVNEKPLPIEQLVGPVIAAVVKVSGQAGVNPLNAISGASYGIIQGAAETGTDLADATRQAIAAAKEVAAQIGLPEESAVAKAAEATLQAAEAIGPEAVAKVVESLPKEVLPSVM
jgi:MFS family permease/enamine deaminase RidA (YjgF/YER057c/UK114 family)